MFRKLMGSLLEIPLIYNLVQNLFMAKQNRAHLFRYVSFDSDSIVIDIGCGTSKILEYLDTNVKYIGYDINIDYVIQGKRRYRDRGAWFVGDASSIYLPRDFDKPVYFLMIALIHHLSDESVNDLIARLTLFKSSGSSKKGALIAIDPCTISTQSWFWKTLTRADRGQYIRSDFNYTRLLSSLSSSWSFIIVKHMRIPYFYCVATLRL